MQNALVVHAPVLMTYHVTQNKQAQGAEGYTALEMSKDARRADQEHLVISTHQYTACKGRAEPFGPACRHTQTFGCLCCMQHVHSWAEDPLVYTLLENAIECFLQNQVTHG
jgi:hypothetical protein